MCKIDLYTAVWRWTQEIEMNVLFRTLYKTLFGKGCGPVVRETMEWMNEWMNEDGNSYQISVLKLPYRNLVWTLNAAACFVTKLTG